MEKFTGELRDISSPQIAEVLLREAEQYAGPTAYVASLLRRYRNEPIHKTLEGLSQWLDPIDRVLGQDEAQPYGLAF